MTTSFRSVHFEGFGHTDDEPQSMIVSMTGARSVHGDTEGVTPEGYYVNTGSYIHADDVADYLVERANAVRRCGDMLVGDVRLTPEGVAEVWESFANLIRTCGV